MSFTSVFDLGWPVDDPLPGGQSRPARVLHQGAGTWRVHDGTTEALARARSRSLTPIPVTGDWVLISDETGTCVIDQVLPRRVTLSRAEAGGRSAEQVIAANVDVAAICASADAANVRRLERELTAVWSSGARPLVLVTKCDLIDDVGSVLADIEPACVGADILLVSSQTGDGLDLLRSNVPAGITMVLIGPSGVGKSSLVNALVGEEVLPTSAVRGDGKGRHTTTSRHLIGVPSGGLLLDTPGMREFAPWVDGEGLDGTFADLDALALECRFNDCRHESEPGCQVLIAAASDEAVARRLESWRRLQRELAWLARRHDSRLMAEERRKWAARAKSARGVMRP